MDTQVADLLGGERVLGASVKSNLDLARATRQGLAAETTVQLVEAIRGSDVWAELQELHVHAQAIALPAMGPLGVLICSLRHIASPARLTPEQSDMVVRTACILAKAIDVLGEKRKAVHWLTSPNRALGGEIPVALLDTSAGVQEVEAVLDRIEYGAYS